MLELGGSDPFIVMPSAISTKRWRSAVKARIVNNGQSCIAAKRFIVHETIADEFERSASSAAMEALKVGDPIDESTDVGPLATPQIARRPREAGAASRSPPARTLLTGGKRIARPGNFYAPTVLADIPRDAPAYREETFGPVASLFRVRDIDEAIALANDTTFGLGASVWTNDRAENRALHRRDRSRPGLRQRHGRLRSARLPFGGVKALRLRPRAGRLRHPRVRECEDGLYRCRQQ